jgi:hypothetical protein
VAKPVFCEPYRCSSCSQPARAAHIDQAPASPTRPRPILRVAVGSAGGAVPWGEGDTVEVGAEGYCSG